MSTSTEIISNFKIRIIIGLKLKSINNNMLLIRINFQMMAQQIEHWPSFILLQHYKIWFYKRLVWYFVLSSFLFLSLLKSAFNLLYCSIFDWRRLNEVYDILFWSYCIHFSVAVQLCKFLSQFAFESKLSFTQLLNNLKKSQKKLTLFMMDIWKCNY